MPHSQDRKGKFQKWILEEGWHYSSINLLGLIKNRVLNKYITNFNLNNPYSVSSVCVNLQLITDNKYSRDRDKHKQL
jgi:hypothetical protein